MTRQSKPERYGIHIIGKTGGHQPAIECSDEDFESGQDMPLLEALVTVKNMTDEQKEVVAQVISAAIVADRIITAEEAVVFDYVSQLTGIDDILDADRVE